MKVECPFCDGLGEVFDRRQVRYDSISPPYMTCPCCGGSGDVDEEDAEDFDDSKSIEEYEEDRAADIWEEREEARRQGDWD